MQLRVAAQCGRIAAQGSGIAAQTQLKCSSGQVPAYPMQLRRSLVRCSLLQLIPAYLLLYPAAACTGTLTATTGEACHCPPHFSDLKRYHFKAAPLYHVKLQNFKAVLASHLTSLVYTLFIYSSQIRFCRGEQLFFYQNLEGRHNYEQFVYSISNFCEVCDAIFVKIFNQFAPALPL